MPDHQADRVLRSIEQNQGELSNVLAREMPVLTEPGIWPAIVEAVSRAFGDGAPAKSGAVERCRPGQPTGR
jgi:hypothetical protein